MTDNIYQIPFSLISIKFECFENFLLHTEHLLVILQLSEFELYKTEKYKRKKNLKRKLFCYKM